MAKDTNRPDNITNMPRNAAGQFLPRSEGDKSIEVVLNESKAKREASSTSKDDARKKEDDKKSTVSPATVEIDETAAQFFDDFFPAGEPGEKGEKAKAEKDKEAEKEKKAKADKEAAAIKKAEDDKKKKAASSKPAQRRTPEPMTPEQIAEIAAQAAAKVIGTPKKEEAKKDEPTLSPGEQRKVTTLKHMEEMFPNKYKDAATRYQTAQNKLRDYAAKWEKDHPGENFDEESDEHEDFFSKNDLYEFWEPDDFDDARLDLLAAKRTEKKDEEQNRDINSKLERLERSEKLRQEAPRIRETQINAGKTLWKHFGDEYAEVMGENGWNKEKSAELEKADPVGYGHRFAVAKDFDLEAGEIYKLYNGLIDYDAKNPVHHAVSDFYIRFEQAMLRAPEDIRTDPEGRVFMASKEYYALDPKKRDPYWTFSAEDVIFKRAQTLAKEVEKSIKDDEERLTKFAELKGWKKSDNNGDRKNTDKETSEENTEEDDGKPGGPSGASESKVAAIKIAADKDRSKSKTSFFDDF